MIFKKKDSTKLSDEALMSEVISGNKDAFSELYERFNRRLYYFFYRMLGNDKEIASDFLQDIFLKIIHKPELYSPEYKFSNWIFSVAHNMCKNEYRKREVRSVVQNEADREYILEYQSGNNAPDKEKLIEGVFKELNKLDESHRSILLLKYKENFSVKEIAEMHDLPLGTIKSRLHYARLALSKRVEKKELL